MGGSPTSHTSRNPARRPSRRRPTGASRAFETASSARSLSRPLTSSCTACGLQWPSCEQTRSARLLFSSREQLSHTRSGFCGSIKKNRTRLVWFGRLGGEERRGREGDSEPRAKDCPTRYKKNSKNIIYKLNSPFRSLSSKRPSSSGPTAPAAAASSPPSPSSSPPSSSSP